MRHIIIIIIVSTSLPLSPSEARNSGTNWASSGHNLTQGSRPGGPQVAAPFQSPTEKAFRSSRSRSRRFQNPSPFDHDLNDF
ncbi:hypothetical protein PoB_004880200 [Plakobranchus ocellatus]|uniref:Secreted protein n=1 Tax=Plakobranchus ocellatus TaxID=259542 RepID=A0AAV4BSD3_9GAST|nr:hypothetical protein PoB_004880200 [Plakobranchus ocellatus]